MTNYPQVQCKRCSEPFHQVFAEQVYCDRCRRVMIAAEDASVSKERRREQSQTEIQLYHDAKNQHLWDVRIIDEFGKEVWAFNLAKRYRTELNARRNRDYRNRH